jgi:hypothetical protein
VPPLEMLSRLEIEFHHRLRTQAAGDIDIASPHTSYALQCGYEPLLYVIAGTSSHELETLCERLTPSGDARDIRAACNFLKQRFALLTPSVRQ